ncbi:homocitrate synthase [Epichloe bromicola]|uniref:Homocitrate synthase n=1 Tax=Epichloe bromicola TaxID=79588 RepID=A0ABQ0CNV2_9HYPO
MPLHLLGKKSWNVYNVDNVARVRRDEAAAKAAEEAEEQRMQEIDAQRRLAILRGEAPPPLTGDTSDDPANANAKRENPCPGSGSGRPGRKRKREGEDDTDFELRLARERAEPAIKPLETSSKQSSSAPIVDRRGHFDLFGDEKSRGHAEKNEEAEREARKKKRELEDQYTMRLSNAAGKGGIQRPWYSQGDADRRAEPLKDMWGNDDPRRKQRDTDRMAADDPLAMMKKGASRVRELKQERRKIQDERDEDLRQMRKEDRRRERHRGKHDGESRHRGASPKESSRRRQRSRERKDDGYKRDHDRDGDCDRGRDREQRRH